MPRSSSACRQPATVIVCAYSISRLESLRRLVPSVCDQLVHGDELVVVIDHNSDLLACLEHEFATAGGADRGSPVRVVCNEGDPGLSGARNTGVGVCRGDLVVFLDDDAFPRPDWLHELTRPFVDPETIGVGGLVVPEWESRRPGWIPDELLWVVGCSYRGVPAQPVAIRNPIGANMALRRSVIEAVGGFTAGIGRVGKTPLGCEETELSIRATHACGGRIVQQPTAVVDHLVTAERARISYFLRRSWAEGISKAAVARLAGTDAALESERSYVTRTLPLGVARALGAAALGEPAGLGRAGVIIVCCAVTVAGYLRGSVARIVPAAGQTGQAPRRLGERVESGPASAERLGFVPMFSGQLELTESRGAELEPPADGMFERARLLVRAAGTPLGFVDSEMPEGKLDVVAVVSDARAEFAEPAEAATCDPGWIDRRGPFVSVVLCTHNRPDGARRTLESLVALRYEQLEIVVVDNAPADGATARITDEFRALDPRVRYVCEPQKGLSRGRNAGLREATGEIVAFTDDDVRVDPLWIQGLLRGFDRDPTVACVTGLVASSSLSSPTEQYFDQRVWWSSSCEPRLHTARSGEAESPLHPFAAGKLGTGANFAGKTEVLRALGGFDQCLGAGARTRGGEDLDIFVRLLLAGHAISYEPSALVWHDHRVDPAALREQMYGYGLGLTAYLTKYALAKQTRGFLMRRSMTGIWYGLALLRRSSSSSPDPTVAGAGATLVEALGMVAGPVAYMRARRGQSQQHLTAVAPHSVRTVDTVRRRRRWRAT